MQDLLMEEEWEKLLDFPIEDHALLSWDSEDQPSTAIAVNPVPEAANPNSDDSDRVRKRDPRLSCSNFLAGRVPCSCPEVDEKDEEAEAVRKRARTVVARCQVPGCEADISELKGYHKRHRVCLRCANATTVFLDGQPKRYCQQCGKFHLLPDFDEGKRSCRRKLERHNRRRRKPVEFINGTEHELQGNVLAENIGCNEAGKALDHADIFQGVSGGTESFCLSNRIIDTETLLESECGQGSPFFSAVGQMNPGSQNMQGNGDLSFVASGETQMDRATDNSRSALSSSFCGNKTAYSSVCPTGRISFKLYDWNPAEFPRRLRHQIFQWLASMPVELEGYMRPGCTILTFFIAMPRFMWDKLLDDAAAFVDDLVNAPESLLSGRDNMLIYLNNVIFQVLKGGTFLLNSNMELQVPRLHYVDPICFEAGKPMEFVVCGSNLLHPKFRFLVSFAGKYLEDHYCVSIPHRKSMSYNEIKGSSHDSNHEIFRIFIPPMESKLFGPAFIEVENENGISNFIPVLVGDRQTCDELQMIHQKVGESVYSKSNCSRSMAIDTATDPCEIVGLKQAATSEFILDIAWLLKEPQFDEDKILLTSMQIERLNCLLHFLTENGSISVTEKILQSLKSMMDVEELCDPVNKTSDVDLKSFQKCMGRARKILQQRLQLHVEGRLALHSEILEGGSILSSGFECDMPRPRNKLDVETSKEEGECLEPSAKSHLAEESNGKMSLLGKEIIMEVNHRVNRLERQQQPYNHFFPSTILSKRFFALGIASFALCCAICLVYLHPHKIGEFAVSVRRCLFGSPKL